MAKPVYSEPVEVRGVEDIEPLQDEIIKEVVEYTDEDGRVISKYMRGTLPEPVAVRGGQIVLPKRRRRKAG